MPHAAIIGFMENPEMHIFLGFRVNSTKHSQRTSNHVSIA